MNSKIEEDKIKRFYKSYEVFSHPFSFLYHDYYYRLERMILIIRKKQEYIAAATNSTKLLL